LPQAKKFRELSNFTSFWNFLVQTLTEAIISSQLRNHVLSEDQIQRLTGGSPDRRYGLVNRALKAGELMRKCIHTKSDDGLSQSIGQGNWT
jgi:hypothetical protein